MNKEYPVILAITAASGIIFGIKILEFLLRENYKTELIFSEKAYFIAKSEIGLELSNNKENIKNNILKFLKMKNTNQSNLKIWLNNELWASPASGSYRTNGMIIAPASMATVSAIACGMAENLISRAADVCLKEKRMLTLVPRETPFNSIHLENMLKLSKLGINIVPPIPAFYGGINTLEQSLGFITGKILDVSGINNDLYERWIYE